MAYIDFQLRHEVVKLKRAIVKVIPPQPGYCCHHVCPHQVLILLFLNGSVWLAGSFLFIHLEGSTEAAHKCGWSITITTNVIVTIGAPNH